VAAWKPLVVLCAIVCALAVRTASAQQGRDPLVDPPSGGVDSRFTVVGEVGWIAGETVTLRLAFTTADPLNYAGPFPYTREITVLRDNTWFFPIVVREDVLGFPLGPGPGFIVVRAESATQTSTNAYVFTVNGVYPIGAEQFVDAGFGPGAPPPAVALTLGLFAIGLGALLFVSGLQSRAR
jgi:hypothetical protein